MMPHPGLEVNLGVGVVQDVAQPPAPGLVCVLQTVPDDVANILIPDGHVLILRRVSKALKMAVEAMRLAVKVKPRHHTPVETIEEGLGKVTQCFCIGARLFYDTYGI